MTRRTRAALGAALVFTLSGLPFPSVAAAQQPTPPADTTAPARPMTLEELRAARDRAVEARRQAIMDWHARRRQVLELQRTGGAAAFGAPDSALAADMAESDAGDSRAWPDLWSWSGAPFFGDARGFPRNRIPYGPYAGYEWWSPAAPYECYGGPYDRFGAPYEGHGQAYDCYGTPLELYVPRNPYPYGYPYGYSYGSPFGGAAAPGYPGRTPYDPAGWPFPGAVTGQLDCRLGFSRFGTLPWLLPGGIDDVRLSGRCRDSSRFLPPGTLFDDWLGPLYGPDSYLRYPGVRRHRFDRRFFPRYREERTRGEGQRRPARSGRSQ